MITLATELQQIRGLSPTFLAKLTRLGIRTVRDIIFHFPTRYEDFSKVVAIAALMPGQATTIRGTVRTVELRRTWKKRMLLTEAVVSDETGGVKAIWFNQPYIAKILKPGMAVNLAGKVVTSGGDTYLSNPSYEPVRWNAETRHTAGLIPVYPETKGLTSRGIRYLVKPLLKILPKMPEPIPEDILAANRLPEVNAALQTIHFPKTIAEAERARIRFAFEDLLLLQIVNLKLRSALAREAAPPFRVPADILAGIKQTLPFILTASQERSLEEILKDCAAPRPMNRLLQGDVGSGKTVIAALAAIVAAENNYQTAFMAPTEVLATQHYGTFRTAFRGLLASRGITCERLTAGMKVTDKKRVMSAIREGEAQIVIGTHALLQKGIAFSNLALVIVDEQHRFGVEQRAALLKNEAPATHRCIPHFLSMSATPIPRTLSLTVFGDLDLSIIDELPVGRKPIVTKVVAPENRGKAYAFIREQIKKGRQAFVICPRIEPSTQTDADKIKTPLFTSNQRTSAMLWETKAVKEEYEKLSKKIFPDLKVGMLHGKMKSKEKEVAMTQFKERTTDLLVATSVIEVGVDVPNASIMMVEGAEHFGLAQLYQFRGRIGRGEHQSYCLLFTESDSQSVRERLDALLKAKNGFELAELDLQIRGPGEFLGDKQTGIPDLAMRSLTNFELVRSAREAARTIIEADLELVKNPFLKERVESFERGIHLE